jgi:hypothetical protein
MKILIVSRTRGTAILLFLIWQMWLLLGAKLINGQTLSFHKNFYGFHLGSQVTFDVYKPYGSIYFKFRRTEKPFVMQPGNEREIYSQLVRRLLVPTYFLLQGTAYPLAALSSLLETDHLRLYNRFQTPFDLNVVRTIGAGYEEPYAISLFLGNILLLVHSDSLKPGLRQSGSALAGFLISGGYHQIHNNIYFPDRFYQVELMLIGNFKEPRQRRLTWNFRLGAKIHQKEFLRDMITVSVERSHSDWRYRGWSPIRNAIFKYQGYFPAPNSENKTPAGLQLISVGKKFPISVWQRKLLVILAAGVRWEWVLPYHHEFQRFADWPVKQLTWLVQPNIEF